MHLYKLFWNLIYFTSQGYYSERLQDVWGSHWIDYFLLKKFSSAPKIITVTK